MPAAPPCSFAVDVPTTGTYALYFDFSHGGSVHTASVIAAAAATADAPATDDHHAD